MYSIVIMHVHKRNYVHLVEECISNKLLHTFLTFMSNDTYF